jgi:glycosyltransferase involved in cell wall biosynthesis
LCLPFRRRVFVSDLGGSGWDISFRLSTERWYTGHLHISDYSRQISGHMDKPWAHVIMGGVDTVKFSPKPSVEKDGVVRFVGRILPHKGVDDLIRALPPDMSLEIIGKAYDRPFLDHLQSLAAGKRVSFRHDCQDDNLIEAYRQALCVVLPSVYVSSYNGSETRIPELLGQTLLEAMACGSPAICTDVASMPELVMDSVTGFVTPPNNPDALQEKLMWLRDHPAQAAEMGRAARNHVTAHFKWSTIVDRCIKHYGIEKDA